MELKINEVEIKTLLEGFEKLLETHDERIIKAIGDTANKIGNILDDIEEETSNIEDILDEEHDYDLDDDDDDENFYYLEEICADDGDLRIFVVTDDEDEILDYVVIKNTGKTKVEDIDDVKDLYDEDSITSIEDFTDADKAIAYMKELKLSIDSGIYTVYRVIDTQEGADRYLAIVTGEKHAETNEMAFMVERSFDCRFNEDVRGFFIPHVNNMICDALSTDSDKNNEASVEVLYVGSLKECTEVYDKAKADHRKNIVEKGK